MVNKWWKALCADSQGSEKVDNLICMNHSAHKMYEMGLFTLGPLHRDPESRWMTLKLWWLKSWGSTGNFVLPTVSQIPINFGPQDIDLGLHHVRTDHPLRCGDVIILTTHKPLTHPLPDTRLLQLQWLLNRVTAILMQQRKRTWMMKNQAQTVTVTAVSLGPFSSLLALYNRLHHAPLLAMLLVTW